MRALAEAHLEHLLLPQCALTAAAYGIVVFKRNETTVCAMHDRLEAVRRHAAAQEDRVAVASSLNTKNGRKTNGRPAQLGFAADMQMLQTASATRESTLRRLSSLCGYIEHIVRIHCRQSWPRVASERNHKCTEP